MFTIWKIFHQELVMSYTHQPLEEGHYYHIYNKSISDNSLFIDQADYEKFIGNLEKYTSEKFKCYAYCLVPNHFHLLLSVSPGSHQNLYPLLTPSGVKKNRSKASLELSHLFNSYAQYFNFKYQRKGGLFLKPFRRKRLNDMAYFNMLICYIHLNPLKHKIFHNYLDYPFSSIIAYKTRSHPFIKTKEAIRHFGSWDNFWQAHKETEAKIRLL